LTVYVDTSFVVSLYVTDRHSADARRRILSAPAVLLTPLHDAEWAHALAQHVFRNEMTAAEARQFEKQLEDDKVAGVWVVGEFPENAFDLCVELGRRYGPKLGLRTLDTLHVACAIERQATHFWTFDDRQHKLAKAIGLRN
jgi:predicted nucleic acid-binding protein